MSINGLYWIEPGKKKEITEQIVQKKKLLSEGFELKHSFYMQETVNWSSKLTFSRERWSGIAPC